MKHLILIAALLAAPALAQVPANPSKITVEAGSGSTVTETVRPNDMTRNVHITHNPGDSLTVITPVVMHSGLKVDTSTLAAPAVGYDTQRVRETTQEPEAGGGGQFRTVCASLGGAGDLNGPAWFAPNDPIVYPGQPGRSHDHIGFGNVGLDAFSTVDTLMTSGNVACKGGTVNHSSYWIPQLIDTRTSKPILPTDVNIYYKNATYPRNLIEFLPHGLRMIAGDPMASAPQPNNSSRSSTLKCGNAFYTGIPTDQTLCPPGSKFILGIFFPQCWDGTNLDSPDHKSHMSYGSSVKVPGSNPAVYQRVCPATHPKILPQLSFQLDYIVTDSRYMRFVSDTNSAQPAGWTAHGDVISAWEDKWMRMWVTNCLQAGAECFSHLLGRDPEDGKLKMIY